MKWAYLLGSPDISGGSYVIFSHALYAARMGHEITIITESTVDPDRLQWYPEARDLDWRTYDSLQGVLFDVVIATWWKTVFELHRIPAKHYVYFVQSIESRFYPEVEKPLRQLVDATYTLPIRYITEAKWIKQHLKMHFGRDAYLVPNGIRKDVYSTDGDIWEPRVDGKLRILIEGPIDVAFKNVPKAINLCLQAGADEIWLLTSSPIKKYSGVNRVFSKIPIHETPKIYRSCDIVVKLSYVEGMFGPPLEMFHCGGTTITYDVTGHDEYIVNGVNGIVIRTDHESEIIESIKKLKNKFFLDNLKYNALKTAKEWPDWNESSTLFLGAVEDILKADAVLEQKDMEILTKTFFDCYVTAENYRLELSDKKALSLYQKTKEYIRNKHPHIFWMLKKGHLLLIRIKRKG